MRRTLPALAVLLFILGLTVMVGCGGNASRTTPPPTTATPAPPPAPAPSPTPTPTPTPAPPPSGGGTGGGGSTAGTAQWNSSVDTGTGTVTVTTAGDVTVQVSHEQPSTSFAVNFCQWPGSDYDVRGQNPCFALNQTLMTDASGNGQLTFHFPQSGPWAGAFFFAPGGDMSAGPARISTDTLGSAGTLSSPLLSETKIDQGRVPSFIFSGSPQDPGGGTVSLSGGKVTATLKGAAPNATYTLHECFSGAGSACRPLGTFTTDASGNGATTMSVAAGSGSVFDIYQSNLHAYGFVTGFTVP